MGDSGAKKIPMIAISGTTQQEYARKCQAKYVPIRYTYDIPRAIKTEGKDPKRPRILGSVHSET